MKQPRGSEKGRKSLILIVCFFVFVGVRIWFSNGDACYVGAEEWFHEAGTILKEKNSTRRAEGFWSGKRKVGRTVEILFLTLHSPPTDPREFETIGGR